MGMRDLAGRSVSGKWRGGAVLLLATVFAACGSADPEPTCTGLAPISVSSDPAPVFDWAAACAIDRITVLDVATDQSFWLVSSPTDFIEPPVTFGITPPGASTGPGGAPPASGGAALLILHRLGPPASADTVAFQWP